MKYICSNMVADNCYVEYVPSNDKANDLPRRRKSVTVKGGTGIANKNVITPLGVVTSVSDDDCAFLEAHPVFKKQMKRGFLQVLKKSPSTNEREKISTEELKEDKSAPLTPEKLSKEGKKAAKTKKKKQS